MDITLIISAGVLIGCFIALSWFAGSDAPYVATKIIDVKKILKIAGVKKGKKFYDLGSGDGRVVITAAQLKADAVGVEQSWLRVLFSKLYSLRLNLKKAHFRHGNFFSQNYSDGDILYIYLLPKPVKRLQFKLRKELKKDSIVITRNYHFPNWRPFKKLGEFWLYTKT